MTFEWLLLQQWRQAFIGHTKCFVDVFSLFCGAGSVGTATVACNSSMVSVTSSSTGEGDLASSSSAELAMVGVYSESAKYG
jgi:hypothetical protein